MNTALTHPETDIFKIQPSLKDHWGVLFLGIVTIPVFGLGFLVLMATWLSVKNASYRMTGERLFLKTGIISRRVQETELYRIKDVAFSQSLMQRLLGVGDVTVVSTDATTPTLTLKSIRNPEQIKETIRTTFRAARKTEGVRVAEHSH